ncbi:hypothetical protein LTR56_024966 [Elasticomyces elasticus]|nr:hypothetical protein LTR56_024966 [Elasticomyces elasticus]KAK3626591.1 hypothetical protein LTR22_023110 [Elasticomyces elasticus]KAK4922825.1 hypothetical protein LTR49_009832 [Elasticomyces elasticus]KAK5759798.1 hypothetical protein LTS12_010138 [Elasticomyces elasticus]
MSAIENYTDESDFNEEEEFGKSESIALPPTTRQFPLEIADSQAQQRKLNKEEAAAVKKRDYDKKRDYEERVEKTRKTKALKKVEREAAKEAEAASIKEPVKSINSNPNSNPLNNANPRKRRLVSLSSDKLRKASKPPSNRRQTASDINKASQPPPNDSGDLDYEQDLAAITSGVEAILSLSRKLQFAKPAASASSALKPVALSSASKAKAKSLKPAATPKTAPKLDIME